MEIKKIRKGTLVKVEYGEFGIITAKVCKRTGYWFEAYMPVKYIGGDVHRCLVSVPCDKVVELVK